MAGLNEHVGSLHKVDTMDPYRLSMCGEGLLAANACGGTTSATAHKDTHKGLSPRDSGRL